MKLLEFINLPCDLARQYEEACRAGDWVGALQTLNKSDRPEALQELMLQHGVERLFEAINFVWTDTENVWGDEEIWDHIWFKVTWVWDRKARAAKLRQRRRNVMDKDERKFFDALPEILTLYRGFDQEGGVYGWSWTLDRSKAEWFARRFPGCPQVATIEIPKADMLAYFNGREEAEIVVSPETLGGIDEFKIEDIERLQRAA